MKGLLAKIEVLIGAVLLLIFIVWVYSKCDNGPALPSEDAAATVADSLVAPDGTMPDALREKIAARAAADSAAALAKKDTTATAALASNAPTYSQLYVTIDKLKIRKSPGLNSEVLGELKLFDKVFYLEEVTDSTFEVNLGKAMADEPYVKVKTKRGTVGWVYGAGVHYMKKKREGVLE